MVNLDPSGAIRPVSSTTSNAPATADPAAVDRFEQAMQAEPPFDEKAFINKIFQDACMRAVKKTMKKVHL